MQIIFRFYKGETDRQCFSFTEKLEKLKKDIKDGEMCEEYAQALHEHLNHLNDLKKVEFSFHKVFGGRLKITSIKEEN